MTGRETPDILRIEVGGLYDWKGWEYETPNGNHMYQSLRHYFLDGQNIAVCGKQPIVFPDKNSGNEGCKKCVKWADKNNVQILL